MAKKASTRATERIRSAVVFCFLYTFSRFVLFRIFPPFPFSFGPVYSLLICLKKMSSGICPAEGCISETQKIPASLQVKPGFLCRSDFCLFLYNHHQSAPKISATIFREHIPISAARYSDSPQAPPYFRCFPLVEAVFFPLFLISIHARYFVGVRRI